MAHRGGNLSQKPASMGRGPEKICTSCNGARNTMCFSCKGTGKHSGAVIDLKQSDRLCHNCHGSGRVNCTRCGGSGKTF